LAVSYSTCAVEIVMPRAFSSGALSIWSYAVNVAPPDSPNLRDRRRQRRLAVVNVTDRANVAVRLVTLKLCFGHERRLDVDHREAGDHARPMTLLRPFSTPGMYSFGTEPPTTLDSNTKPARLVRLDHELDAGELAGTTGLLLVGVVDFGRFVIVSRYATCGAPIFASTL
jgi:hypothetical protein